MCALSVALFSGVAAAQNPVGIFDAQADVGHVRKSGSVSYDQRLQSYLIAGSGQNMWADRDDFHFVWKRMTGNFILSARAHFDGKGIEAHRKIGWTIRPSLETNAAHVTAALHGDGLASLQFRRVTGGTTEEVKSRDSLPNADAVIQLERRDGVYIMSVARFGDTLVTHEIADVTLPDTVYVGLFVCAHNDTVIERAGFSNVRITTPAKRDLVPYRDYIGSNLEILDVASGNATVVHSYRGSFQAPNWTHDGKALIYAQEGRIVRFDLSRRVPDMINTGFATRNNNDHVLSFDGRMLAISHHAVEDSGASIVYTLPVTGGTPKRATAKGPSYLHGWSPDGRWLVYTGQRAGEFDIYKVGVGGGDEIRLTSTPGLDDGPEYTPDGKYIYFNSVRSGRMQIWRMRPDGSDQKQITNDGFNNWFPHISPNGKWIVYIAFPPEVPANDHPFYKHVLLKLIPVGGGPARVIAYVYGGQGTINVPSWSPDGTRLAFVSNSTMSEGDPRLTEAWEPVPRLVAPGVGAAPPSDAIVLFSGNDLSQWQHPDGSAAKWKVARDAFTVVKSTGNIQTRRAFGDCQLHIEWRTPAKVEGEGQDRGNSGVFLQGRYEVQVLDSYNNRTYSNGQAASIYKQYIPLVNASRKPGEWQSYDIFFRAPRFAENGTAVTPGYMTVVHNGVLVQDHVEIKGTTFNVGPQSYQKHNPKEPLMLQDHGHPVSYRNIWIREL